MKEEKVTTEEKTAEEKPSVAKETPIVHKDRFRCKKCTTMKPLKDARVLIVMQMNKPLEFPNIRFQTKAEVSICRQCYEEMKRD